jgi:hypothetical protein
MGKFDEQLTRKNIEDDRLPLFPGGDVASWAVWQSLGQG